MSDLPQPKSPQTITADQLGVLTGLTDRRHRQLADEGFFPLPKKSEYLLVPTIQGLFRYYRELSQKAKSRLIEINERKAEKEDKILGLKLAREEKKSVDRAEVDKLFLHIASKQKVLLYAMLENEYPGKALGRTASELRLIGREMADKLCSIMQRDVEKWTPESE